MQRWSLLVVCVLTGTVRAVVGRRRQCASACTSELFGANIKHGMSGVVAVWMGQLQSLCLVVKLGLHGCTTKGSKWG